MTDKVTALILLAFSGLTYLVAGSLPQPMYESLGPGFFPKVLSLCLAGLGLWLFVQAVLSGQRAPSSRKESVPAVSGIGQGTKRMLICGGLTLAYVLALGPFGFLWATGAFLLAIMGYLSQRNLRESILIVLISAIYVAVVYYSFTHLLRIFLP